MDWVIDTDVLVRAEDGDERHDHCFNVLGLLGVILKSGHDIVIDDCDKINSQYRNNLYATGLVYRFLKTFASRGQVRYVSGRLINRLSTELRRLGFDSDDDVFVAVATRTSSGRLVAEESDYTDSVVDYLSSEGLQVLDCQAASAEST